MEMMTYELLLGPPTARKAAKQAAQRAAEKRANDTMPDNKTVGWRKKIQSKPKELQPLKASTGDSVGTDDSSERRRHHGWRRTIQGSRPVTPAIASPATPAVIMTEEAHAERAEFCTPRRDSKPKLIRYTSLFSGFTTTSKSPGFSEPWGEEPPSLEPYSDPKIAISSIRAHMANFSTVPIPLEHNSNLFRIFEDYHKGRNEIDCLTNTVEDMCQKLDRLAEQWESDESQYVGEIRRLELLIAQSATGVAGVLHARQGTVLDRKRMHRKTISNSKSTTWAEFLTEEQIDTEIASRSRQVLLQRSTSPSTKMTALSRHFTGSVDPGLFVGTPPKESNPTLSRKVQTELNLIKLGRINDTGSVSSIRSEFSGGTGDPLPDEMSSPSSTMDDMTADCDAIIALRELGTLVARRRGLNTATFVEDLMRLLCQRDDPDQNSKPVEPPNMSSELVKNDSNLDNLIMNETTPQHTLCRFQSQPQLNTDQKRRRNFSFESGEDSLQALNDELAEAGASQMHRLSSKTSRSPVVESVREDKSISSPGRLASPIQSTAQDTHNVSKIPSPVHVYGSVRREGSISSQQSIKARSSDSRHNSQSSILTAFRDTQTTELRPLSSSRSSSFNTLRSAEISPSSNDRRTGARIRGGTSNLPADHQTAVSQGDSPTRVTTKQSTTSSHGATRITALLAQENNEPKKCG